MARFLIIIFVFTTILVGGTFALSKMQIKPADDSVFFSESPKQVVKQNTVATVTKLRGDLADVTGGSVSGIVEVSYYDMDTNEYTLTASLFVTEPADGYFYEGWLVQKSTGAPISTGEAFPYDHGTFVNNFTSDQDLTSYNFYVLTLEPRDGDPKPAKHILEGDLLVESKDTIGLYTDYDDTLLINAEKGRVILFFKASGCPTCDLLDRSIINNIKFLPGDVTILKVDYDTSQDLKAKYGVVSKHTLVQVDSVGMEIKRWVGITDLARLVFSDKLER